MEAAKEHSMPTWWLCGATSLQRLPERESIIVLGCFEHILHQVRIQVIEAYVCELTIEEAIVMLER